MHFIIVYTTGNQTRCTWRKGRKSLPRLQDINYLIRLQRLKKFVEKSTYLQVNI